MLLRTRSLSLRATRILARWATLLVTLVAVAALSGRAAAGPTVGFIEEWSSSPGSWGGGAAPDNPGTGGLLGAGDGYLRVATPAPAHLGTFSVGSEYVGDWVAAGITQVHLWLNDIDTDDPLEIHVLLGHAQQNIWQYNVGFVPPEHEWGAFAVDLSSSANWTQTQGTLSFTDALHNLDRILIRHDLAPYEHVPDDIQADVGIDHLVLSNGLVGVSPRTPLVPVELAPPSPNPSRGPVTLVFRAPDTRPVRVEIVDASGRRVRRADLDGGSGGPRVWLWDGRDDTGHAVAPGVYRARAIGAGGGTSRSLVRVR